MWNYGLLNLGSLVFGLMAWILPIGILVKCKRVEPRDRAVYSAASISACAVSLCMQIYYSHYLVRVEDWSALMDTSGAVAWVATTLLVVTLILNGMSLALHRGRNLDVR